MTESINPGYSFESGGFDKKDSGKGNAKKNSAPSFRPSLGESKPAPQFMEVGNTPFSAFSGKDLGGEAVKSAGLFERDKPETPKPEAEFHEPESHKSETPVAERPTESQARESAERAAAEQPKPRENLDLQSVSSEQLAELAAREARAQLHAQELARESEESEREGDKAKKDKAKDRPAPATQPNVKAEAQAPEPETPRAETLEEILAREMPAEFADSTSDGTLTNEATPDLPPRAETPAEMLAAEQIDTAHELAEPQTPQPSELSDFDSFVQRQPELRDFAEPLTKETLAAAAAPSASAEHASDDDVFREIAQNETGEDPGRATLHDITPGSPPVSTGGGANHPPNIPPTARGGPGGYGGGPNPNNPFSNPYNNPNVLNPNTRGNPNLLSNILNPATAAGLAALTARERLRNARNLALIVGLAGGEALLAAGLVGEHLWNSHKRRQMRRDYNNKFERQNKALKKTNQQLEQEHFRHQQTRRQLENVSAAQTATNEELRRTAGHKLPVAEAAAGAGLISAAAASELAARTERTAAGAPTLPNANEKINEREIEHRLRNSRELGRAIERNPELRDSLRAAETAGAAAAIATAERSGAQPHQLRELVGASTYADTLRRERNFEYLQTEPTEDAGQAHQTGGGADVQHGMSSSSSSQQQSAVPIATQSDAQLNVLTDEGRPAHRSIVKPAVAATVLFALGVVLIAIFAA